MNGKQTEPTPLDEEVSIDELGKRYERIYNLDLRDSHPQRDAENHFCLGLLYLATGRFEVKEEAHGRVYCIPSWSDFAEAAIAAREGAKKP